jgi:hypothetical protein
LYAGTLSDKRQEFRLKQAKDILRGLGVVETLLSQGNPLGDALDDAAQAVGPDGRMVLGDLVVRLRTAPADEAALAVREFAGGRSGGDGEYEAVRGVADDGMGEGKNSMKTSTLLESVHV